VRFSQKFPKFLVVVQREVFFKGRGTLFEKMVSLPLKTPLFPKTF